MIMKKLVKDGRSAIMKISLCFFFLTSISVIPTSGECAQSVMSGGSSYTVVLKSDGNLWSWGDNVYGQLGDGTNSGRNTPLQIDNSGEWISVVAGKSGSTIALKSNGTLWTWERL